MLRQNPANPCELQQYNESTGRWDTIFDVSLCKDSGSTPGADGAVKRCNIASFLTEILLPDAMESSLSAKETLSSVSGFFSVLLGIFASFATGGTAILLFSASGGTALGNLLLGMDAGNVRLQLTNQFWLDVKRQLFCALPDDGVLTQAVLESVAQAIERNISISIDAR